MSETKKPEPLPGMLPEMPLAECQATGHVRYVRMRREIYDAGDLRALLAWLPAAVAWVEAGDSPGCAYYTTDPSTLRDCHGDGHFLCRTCAREEGGER